MIRGLIGHSGIVVEQGQTTMPYFNMNVNNPMIGMLRYNSACQGFEVFDGVAWVTIPSAYASVKLSQPTERLIHWATEKMAEEDRLENLAKQFPTMRDLLNQKADIESKIAMVETLVKPELVSAETK